jgi:hypothetical protein
MDSGLVVAIQDGSRSFGLGTFDGPRTPFTRTLLKGSIPRVMRLRAAQKKSVPTCYVVLIEDITRGDIRLAPWASYFGLELKSVVGAWGTYNDLCVSESYPPEVLASMRDYSAIGAWIQSQMAENVEFVHISIRGNIFNHFYCLSRICTFSLEEEK